MEASFIIFGGTGDLARNKLVPALFNLFKSNKIKNLGILSVGRRYKNKGELIENYGKKIGNSNKEKWEKFTKKIRYFKGDLNKEESYEKLKKSIEKIEEELGLSKNRIFYLSTLPHLFGEISKKIDKHGLTSNEGWNRIAFEKPFGNNLRGARRINKEIRKIFSESQIYRIDHYLGKELVQNISILRFTNVIDPLLHRNYIDNVQIVVSEDFGVKDRGEFYDKYGALKDVVQNHLMQLLALTAMEMPIGLEADHIRNEKASLLDKVSIDKTLLGQYEGYKKEEGVNKNSKTETLAALRLFINKDEWEGVPFYLITGKNLKEKFASIHFEFQESPYPNKKIKIRPNSFVINIQPDTGIFLKMNVKVPEKDKTEEVRLNFCHHCMYPNTPRAYENLFLEILKGNQTSFVRFDEIEKSWKLIEEIDKPKPETYKKGQFPEKLEKMFKEDKINPHFKKQEV